MSEETEEIRGEEGKRRKETEIERLRGRHRKIEPGGVRG